ncbi:hypothetical protein FPSE_02384 [Fusarium pseudograminearum CS3096]|uniref:Uncharacterized protein n=1 Tax=Fusarium pseudograminearum (strain CS3096) TaxID=1028729 RepID=K3UXP9_FUSPC|nr:hypothetical protein FPSE_02384 [Fusarium pseudograminearum CS3096]EKJ77511.1 hypothetical protein FPSE_02384 [Fusarium pseudograminearum CS3096]
MSREDQKCYYPSGDEASSNRYSVCDSDETSFKTCCPAPWTCLKNGLCESLTGKARPIASIARGACTDQNWSGCPSICPLEQSNTSVYVKQCDDGKYCCRPNESYNCCSGGDFRFSLKDPRMTPVAAIAGGTVGSVVGVAILVGLGWWFWKKRSTRDQAGNGAVDENSSKGSQVAHPSVVEIDAGPDSVLVESDARTTQPNRIHELAA